MIRFVKFLSTFLSVLIRSLEGLGCDMEGARNCAPASRKERRRVSSSQVSRWWVARLSGSSPGRLQLQLQHFLSSLIYFTASWREPRRIRKAGNRTHKHSEHAGAIRNPARRRRRQRKCYKHYRVSTKGLPSCRISMTGIVEQLKQK